MFCFFFKCPHLNAWCSSQLHWVASTNLMIWQIYFFNNHKYRISTTLIRQIWFNHQSMPFNFFLSWWFLSGETSTSGPLASAAAHTRILVVLNREISPDSKFCPLTSVTASSKETCIQEKWSFSFQVLNYFWKWTVVKTLKFALCLSILIVQHWFSNLTTHCIHHIPRCHCSGSDWVNLGWSPSISTFQKLRQYFCIDSVHLSNDYNMDN